MKNDEYQRSMPDESSDVALKLGVAVIADRPAIFCIRGADALNLISQQATVVVVRPICRGSKSEEGRKAPRCTRTARTALQRAGARRQCTGCACTVAKHEQLRQPQHIDASLGRNGACSRVRLLLFHLQSIKP